MNFINKFLLLTFVFSLFSMSIVAQKGADKKSCEKKDGYWYREKCWETFEDEGIPENKIDEYVDEQIKLINKTHIILDDTKLAIERIDIGIENEDGNEVVIILAKLANSDKTFLTLIGKNDFDKKKKFKATSMLVTGDIEKLDEQVIKKSSKGQYPLPKKVKQNS